MTARKTTFVALAVLSLAASAACSADADDTGGSCSPSLCSASCIGSGYAGGTCVGSSCSCVGGGDGDADGDADADDCSEAAKLVYVIDSDTTLYRFNPRIAAPSAFERVGPVSCASGGSPNSMAVSRDGFAYVLYGESDPLFPTSYSCDAVNRVNIETAECLGPSSFPCGASSFDKFGMGYATNGADTTDETLFIGNSLDGRLASVDLGAGTVRVIGDLPESGPEFTGNSAGELWGFFPYMEPPQAVQINKDDASTITSLDLSALPSAATATEAAWAFAFWGGSFYIFYYVSPPDSSTNVYKLDRDGTVTRYISDTGLRIVGAGVSTCAPIVIL